MKLIYRWLRRHILLVATICFWYTLFILFITTVRTTHVQIADSNGKNHPVTLPLIEHSDPALLLKPLTYSGIMYYHAFSQHVVNITPDDCVRLFRINGKTVPLTKLVHGGICDYIKGFDIDLKPYVAVGRNSFEISVQDYGGWYGLSVKNSYYDLLFVSLYSVLVIEFTVIAYYFLRQFLHLPISVIIIVLLGILIRLFYLSYTTQWERSYDVMTYTGHLDYIRYIGDTFHLPTPYGWEYHQAPLYYIIAAIVYKAARILALNYINALQLLSLVFNLIFLLFGVLIFKILFKEKLLFILSTAILVFLPSGILHSVRIGNESLYYALCSLSLYLLIKYVSIKRNRYFYGAAICIALAIGTKFNGLFLEILLAILFIGGNVKKLKKKKIVAGIGFLLALFLFTLYICYHRDYKLEVQAFYTNVIKGNIPNAMNQELTVGNSLPNYVYLDEKTFISQPFTNSWSDYGGRQFFLNFLLKTMLFGEFNFPLPAQQLLGTIMSIALLSLSAYFFIGLASFKKAQRSPHVVLFLFFVISIVSIIIYRYTYPYAPNSDFRLIFPVIIPIIAFYFSGINFLFTRGYRIVGGFGLVLSLIFLAASAPFLIIPGFIR